MALPTGKARLGGKLIATIRRIQGLYHDHPKLILMLIQHHPAPEASNKILSAYPPTTATGHT